MFKLFSDKYETREVFSDEELDAIAHSKNQVVLVEGCLCVLMLDPAQLRRVMRQIRDEDRPELLSLLLKRVVLGYQHYEGAVRTLLELGARPDGGLASDLRAWASRRGSLDLAEEFGDQDRAFLRAALLGRHLDAVHVLIARLPDTDYERQLAAKLDIVLF